MRSFDKSAFWATGLMLFALFFGAGNLIFPAMLGQQAGEHVFAAMFGFLLTGVGLPLLGIISVGYAGVRDAQSLAARVSPTYGLVFTLLLYLTIGPLFAMPRTATVSFEIGVVPFMAPGVSQTVPLALFSLFFFALSCWLALSPGKLVSRIGKVLTPLLLFCIAILVGAAALFPSGALQAAQDAYVPHPATTGMIDGYNTMDGIVSPIFAVIVLEAVQGFGVHGRRQVLRMVAFSGLLAVFCLALVYVFIAYLGASSVAGIGLQENGAAVLAQTAHFYFGSAGKGLLAVIVFLACLTTSVGLICACAEYFNRLMPQLPYRGLAVLFAVVACVFANYGLSGIIKLSLPVLMLLYPLTIVLVLLTFLHPLFGGSRRVYVLTIAATAAAGLLDAARQAVGFSPDMVGAISRWLPLFEIQLGWVMPAAIAFVAGIMLRRFGSSSKQCEVNK